MGQDSVLTRADLPEEPFALFRQWFRDIEAAGQAEPTAAALATSSLSGQPSLRHVLVKAFDETGFLFFTDARSRKGQQLYANPQAALCFWWSSLSRQVTVEGPVKRVSRDESELYFRRRAVDSQLSSWASTQGSTLSDRAEFETTLRQVEARFAGAAIPCPPHWTGYRVQVQRIEFWQGRGFRRHDRFEYLRDDGRWQIQRLSP